MTDPLDALRAPVEPVDPDPIFAERLRQAVLNPVGGTMTETVAEITESEPAELAWPPRLTPYIMVADARRAIGWYVEVFGATQRGAPYVDADGTIGHAELGIGDAV